MALLATCSETAHSTSGREDSDGNDMAAITIADGWTLLAGTWSTDIDREDSVVYSGIEAIVMKSTAVATSIRSPRAQFVDASSASSQIGSAFVNAWMYMRQDDDGNGANIVTVTVNYYDKAGSLLGTYPAVSGRIGTSGKWYVVGFPRNYTTAAYIDVTVTKAARAFTLYIDSIWGDQEPPHEVQVDPATTTVPGTNVWTSIPFSSYVERGEVDWYTTANKIQVLISGEYMVHAVLRANADITAGQVLDIRLKATRGDIHYYYGQAGAGLIRSASVTALVPADAGMVIEVQARTSGSAQTLLSEVITDAGDHDELDEYCYLSAVRVGR